MRNPINMLNSLRFHSCNKSYQYQRLYKNMFNEDLYLMAYQNIYSKPGNMTEGSDGKTIDGMSMKRIHAIIDSMKDETYQPLPSRRVYIPKKNGKKRPLGVSSFDDKLVQEVIRMILEAIYEDSFSNQSHGFRPQRSCHTALNQIQGCFTGAKWFVEGDIKGFFDNINHDVLINILKERIQDDRFIRLIRKFLNAGYMEDWVYHKTYSGTPQGNIMSPILANVYLDKLDTFMNDLKEQFDKGNKRRPSEQSYTYEKKRGVLAKKLRLATDEKEIQQLQEQIKDIDEKRLLIPYSDPFDKSFKRLQYTRYCDDFIIGVIGSKEEAIRIKEMIHQFLKKELKLELSLEKTLITHSNKRARFLGYDIYVRRSQATKRDAKGRKRRFLSGLVCLEVPMEVICTRLLDYSAMKIERTVYGKENWKPKSRYYLKDNDDLEILRQYNNEIRGFRNYYCIANNSAIVNTFGYIMEYSMYKTYATKYQTSMRKIINKYRIDKDFGIRYADKKGKEKVALFYNQGYKRKPMIKDSKVDLIANTITNNARTSLIDRLQANTCEYCGKTDCEIEIHHVRKLKDLKGKNNYEKLMIARNRKTLALCVPCHKALHKGKLN